MLLILVSISFLEKPWFFLVSVTPGRDRFPLPAKQRPYFRKYWSTSASKVQILINHSFLFWWSITDPWYRSVEFGHTSAKFGRLSISKGTERINPRCSLLPGWMHAITAGGESTQLTISVTSPFNFKIAALLQYW